MDRHCRLVRRLGFPSLAGIALVAAVTARFSPLRAEDWPRFRGPRGDGTTRDATIPLRWSGTTNIRWKYRLPAHRVDARSGKLIRRRRIGGTYYASPVLVGNRLYVVSRFDGTRVLEASPDFKELAHNSLDDKTDFSPSPAVSGGQLFLRSQQWLYCIE